MNIEWTPSSTDLFEGRNSLTGEIEWTGTRADLVFGSNSQLRAIAEVYGCDDAQEAFVFDLRGGMEQGHESRSLRPCLISVSDGQRECRTFTALTAYRSC